MLEGMTALGYMAAHTQRARLGLMVGAVPYRQPGLWLKATTTLDVLSGGRAWFGIGAAWNVEEARSLGVPFPELPDRFRLLEDTLRICSPGVGGGGSRGRLVQGQSRARRAIAQLTPDPVSSARADHGRRRRRADDAAPRRALRGRVQRLRRAGHAAPQVRGAARALRGRRPRLQRDREDEPVDDLDHARTARKASLTPARLVDRLGNWAEAGSHHTIFSVRGVADISKLELIGRDVIPQVRSLGEPSPLD